MIIYYIILIIVVKNKDILLYKNTYSAFVNTNLHEILKSKKVTTLIIAGVETNLCCDSTARSMLFKLFIFHF